MGVHGCALLAVSCPLMFPALTDSADRDHPDLRKPENREKRALTQQPPHKVRQHQWQDIIGLNFFVKNVVPMADLVESKMAIFL